MLAENVFFNDYYSVKTSVLLQKTPFLRDLLDKPKNCQKITMCKVDYYVLEAYQELLSVIKI